MSAFQAPNLLDTPHSGPRIELRPYQVEAVEAIEKAWEDGTRRPLLQLATGLGKTIVFAELARKQLPALIIAHRDELLEQAAQKYRMLDPGATVGKVAASANQLYTEVVVGSVQTLSRDKRLAQLPVGHYRTVIVDEAHHAVADTYRKVIDHLEHENTRFLGVTATPERGMGGGLEGVWDDLVYSRDILWGIRNGYLCDLRGVQVKLRGADLSKLRISRATRDFRDADSAQMLHDAGAPEYAVKAYREHAHGRKAILFTPNVALAYEMADSLRRAGIAAEALDGTVDSPERKAKLERLSTGETMVLCNCFDLETEILTVRGWVGGDDVRDDDVTAAVDPSTGALRWEPISRVVRRERVSGERMVRVANQTLDMRVTEGHRMLWRTRGAKAWKITEARELPDKAGPFELRVAATGDFPGVLLTDDELTFLGIFATDGSLNVKRASIEIAQSATSPTCAEIERVLTACGFDWKAHEHDGKTPAGETRRYRRYRIPKGTIGGQLARSGWGRLESWLDKSLSPRLADCTREQFLAVLHGLWIGDGMKHERRARPNPGTAICGADRVLLDRVQAWAVTRGMACSQTWRPNTSGGKYPDSTIGYVRVRDRDLVTTNNRHVPTSGGNPADFEDEWCDESVWCVTNETGTVIARRRGRVMVAGQCAVLTEGFDEPSVDCIIVARPTLSRVLYTQMIGRGTRTHPGKNDCLVIDLVGVSSRMSLMTVPNLFGISEERSLEGLVAGGGLGLDKDGPPTGMEIEATSVDLFTQRQYRWLRVEKPRDGRERFVLSTGDGFVAIIADGALWDVVHHQRGVDPVLLRPGLDLGYAQGVAEDFVRKAGAEALNKTTAGWRAKPATAKQLEALRKWGVSVDGLMLTAGDASDMLTARIAASRSRSQPTTT